MIGQPDSYAANAQMPNSFGSPYSPYQPYPQQQTTNFYPGNGPIVNSQVTDARPGGYVISHSTVQHPTGSSWQWVGRPDTKPPFPTYPGSGSSSFFPQQPGMNSYPVGQPIVNSQVTDVHPGFVTHSQSTNNPYGNTWQWNGRPNMVFNDPSYPMYRSQKPDSSSQAQSHVVNVHSRQGPTVNSQVTELHSGSHQPVINSQVTNGHSQGMHVNSQVTDA